MILILVVSVVLIVLVAPTPVPIVIPTYALIKNNHFNDLRWLVGKVIFLDIYEFESLELVETRITTCLLSTQRGINVPLCHALTRRGNQNGKTGNTNTV